MRGIPLMNRCALSCPAPVASTGRWRYAIELPSLAHLCNLFNSIVARIAKDIRFLKIQQIIRLGDGMCVSSCNLYRKKQNGFFMIFNIYLTE